jgi:Protein of unknown function (DUF1501)
MKQSTTRRDFLKAAGAATLLASANLRSVCAETATAAAINPEPQADTLILLWMAGGMAHTEMFDPKRHTPYRAGMQTSELVSTFPAVDTVVPGLQFSEGLEKIGSVMDRGAVIRSHVLGSLGTILHTRHQYHWHTGYEPPQTVAAPHMGAWLARIRGPRDDAVPAFIDVGQPYEGNGEAEEIKAFETGGFLGSEYGPFRVPDLTQAVQAVRPPRGMSQRRFYERRKNYVELLKASPAFDRADNTQREALLRSLESAHRLLASPASQAFDLSLEPKKSYDIYNTGRFGLGCLLARRLTEVGARFVEVSTEYVPFLGWDQHDNGHTRLVDMKRLIDSPVAQLVCDLEQRGLLDRTLIVLASEFSRSAMVEGGPNNPVTHDSVKQPNEINELKYYGMHRHFTGASSVLMFGGGVKGGTTYGRTSDEAPCTTIESPATITDVHATIYHLLGVSPKFSYEVEQRPFYVTKDGLGKPISQLLA